MNLKPLRLLAVSVALLHGNAARLPGAEGISDGVAVAIVVDTSGSMKDSVRDGNGQLAPKAKIAKRALASVLDQFTAYLAHGTVERPRRVDIALFAFVDGKIREVLPMRPYIPANAAQIVRAVPPSDGGTPLGDAMKAAANAVLNSKLPRKHVLVISDGENTSGKSPVQILPALFGAAKARQEVISFHMVAFDISAQLFAPIKQLGVNVVGAADEAQLNTQLGLILEQKILLEEEETPAPSEKK